MRSLIATGAGGVKLRVAEHGERSRPAVVLLHGLGRDGDDWSVVGPALANDHWVLCPDARGHGKSDHADEFSFALMADDVVALLDELEIHEAAVVGSSMVGRSRSRSSRGTPIGSLGSSPSTRRRLAWAGNRSTSRTSRRRAGR